MTGSGVASKPICHINLARGYRGSERQTEILIRGIAQWHIAQRLVVLDGEPLTNNLEDLSDLEIIPVADRLGLAARAAKGSAFVHSHGARSTAAAHRANFLYRLPFLSTIRNERPPPAGWLTKRGYRKARVLVAISQAVRKMLMAYAPGVNPLVINSCASAHHMFPATREALEQRYAGKLVVGHIGTLDDSRKGQMDLIAVARDMERTAPDVVFLFVGSGPDEARLRAAGGELSNVEIVGQVQNLGDYLSIMSIFAFPSRHEGLGSTLLDAMDYSLPIVATAVGGIPELVQDSVNGLLVSPGNTDQMAFAIQRLIRDPRLRERLGSKGHIRVQKHTPEAMVESYLEIYQDRMA